MGSAELANSTAVYAYQILDSIRASERVFERLPIQVAALSAEVVADILGLDDDKLKQRITDFERLISKSAPDSYNFAYHDLLDKGPIADDENMRPAFLSRLFRAEYAERFSPDATEKELKNRTSFVQGRLLASLIFRKIMNQPEAEDAPAAPSL